MLVPDVNLFLNVINRASLFHRVATRWLEGAANDDEEFGVPDMILSAVVRISTQHSMQENRRTPAEAFEFCSSVFAMPSYLRVIQGPHHWAHFQRLVTLADLRGGDVADAYLAAFAIENDATFVSFDRGFAKFPGLKVLNPAD
jgi:toxin-antitoxin system PIN domain toxin